MVGHERRCNTIGQVADGSYILEPLIGKIDPKLRLNIHHELDHVKAHPQV
jgi:hypothetical protein